MPPLLDTPTKIWNELIQAGGLDLRYHRDVNEPDMDGDVVQSLLAALELDDSTEIQTALRDPTLTVERFVGALLIALNPFSHMLSDLLLMFERAGATRTDQSLRIEFDFGNAPKLAFDLRQFRDWAESFKYLHESVKTHYWTADELWELNRVLRADPDAAARAHRPAAVAQWIDEYGSSLRWPAFDLPQPRSGDVALDSALTRCFEVWSAVVRESATLGSDRGQLRGRDSQAADLNESQQGGWSRPLLAQLDSDAWAGSVAAGMHDVADRARGVSSPGRANVELVVVQLNDLFSRVPAMTVDQEVLSRILDEFLNLPVWKVRHELYSAWIMTLIADALSDRSLCFHPDDGRLSFSFGGSHLASTTELRPLHVWAELRSPLKAPSLLSGRKRIQPDYTLIAEPITSPNSAIVVVECKQYRAFSLRNFSHAVADYADGRPNAHIVLAAYGPVRSDFLSRLAPGVADRVTLFGGLRPGSERCEEFRGVVRAAVAKRHRQAPSKPGNRLITAAASHATDLQSVSLSWRAAPCDLDLHLRVWQDGAWTSVDFRSSGTKGL